MLRDLELPAEREQLKKEFLREIPENHSYRARFEGDYGVIYSTYSHLARFGYAVQQRRLIRWFLRYFTGTEKEDTRLAGNIGGIWGINTRVFNDLMDGDGCERPSEPEIFWENYIQSFQGEEVSVDTEIETLAIELAQLLGSNLDDQTRQRFIGELQKLSEVALNEDKSRLDTYEDYIEAAGDLGRLTVLAGCSVSGSSVETAPDQIGYEVGLSTQVADDIYDGDTGLEKEELNEILRRKRKDFETKTGMFFGLVLSGGYGTIGKLLYIISEADSKKYGLGVRELVRDTLS